MTNQLIADFHIGAAALGNFSAFYFYCYFLMQVPTGILADYWGPRKLLTAGAFTAAVGTLLFASASSMTPANLGRLLIGGAVGVAFVALLRLSTRWFENPASTPRWAAWSSSAASAAPYPPAFRCIFWLPASAGGP